MALNPIAPRTSTHARHRAAWFAICGGIVLTTFAGLSAHLVRGVASPALAAAFVSSPTNASDSPIKVAWGTGDTAVDTGFRVACFYVANSSAPRSSRPDWPRITAVGFELPGDASGFSLVYPRGDDWKLKEGVATRLAGQDVTLDFAIVAQADRRGKSHHRSKQLIGIPPGQSETRGAGPLFCVSGPLPDSTIETIINGVVVKFEGVEGTRRETDAGVWYPSVPGVPGPGPLPRAIPLF